MILVSVLRRVKIPMMPKGVEHKTIVTDVVRENNREDSNDAERR